MGLNIEKMGVNLDLQELELAPHFRKGIIESWMRGTARKFPHHDNC
jgi:hypothetical protein